MLLTNADTGHGHHPFVPLLSWTSNALAEQLKEKRNRMSSTVSSGERGGGVGGEGERGDGGGEEKKSDGEGKGEKGDGGGSNDSNRNRANSSGSLGSLDTGGSTRSKKSVDQTTVHVRPETNSAGRSGAPVQSETKSTGRGGAPVGSGAPSEEPGGGAGCANLCLTSLHLSDLPLSVGVVSSTGNAEVGEDGGGAGAMQTNPMVPTNKSVGSSLYAHSRHSSVAL